MIERARAVRLACRSDIDAARTEETAIIPLRQIVCQMDDVRIPSCT